MSDFNLILPQTLSFEGGTTVDHAGLTHRGITQSTYDAYAKQNGLKTKPVTELNYGETKDFYYNEFYKKPNFDKLPQKVSAVAFDYGVNSGPSQASKSLQRIVGVKDDGIVGPKTIAAINKYISKNGESDLVSKVLDERTNHLSQLVASDPQKYGKYLDGWANRLKKLRSTYASE